MKLFADTSYFQALRNESDENHGNALRIAASLGEHEIVTTEWVFAELLNSFARTASGRRAAAELIADAYGDEGIEVVEIARQQFLDGLKLYEGRPDKGWSVVDCISFLVMRDRRLTVALTFDIHFEQAGFERVMQPAPRERRGKNL